MKDYTIVAAPRICLVCFKSVLGAAGSPLFAVADSVWTILLKYGVDPALALAQWQHEGNYGKLGVAASHRNPGNLRLSPGVPVVGGFAMFPSWRTGAEGYARLLAGPLYAGSAGYATALTMPKRYAPAADHNNPDAYGAFLVKRIGELVMTHAKHEIPVVDVSATTYVNASGYKLDGLARLAVPAGTPVYDLGGRSWARLSEATSLPCAGLAGGRSGVYLAVVKTARFYADRVARPTWQLVYVPDGTLA